MNTNSLGTKDYEDKMAAARACVIKKAPYFASVVYGFVYRPVIGVRTMCVTPTMILGYDPQWAVAATVEELAADIGHEVHHFLSGHFERSKNLQDPVRANKAGDLAINPKMRDAKWKLSTDPVMGAIFPEDYGLPEGKTMEEYYILLEGANDGKGGGICGGGCGGIGGGVDHPALALLSSEPRVGRTEVEKKVIEKRVANDIKQHAEQHGRGSLPAGLLDWVKAFEEGPHVRWEDELAQVLRDTTGQLQSGGDDYSMRRPSKRSIMRGFPRPGLVEHLPEIAIIRDSSGSMGAKQLTASVREAYFIMQALGIEEVWFCDADTQVSSGWKRVSSQFFKELTEVHGRGGTDFREPIESALKLQPRPDIIVYSTDGDGTTTEMPPPHVSVVWCIVPSAYNRAPADWGHIVVVSNDRSKRKKNMLRPNEVRAAAQAQANKAQAGAKASLIDDEDEDDILVDDP
jgi:predicted metal-dependent peptidase